MHCCSGISSRYLLCVFKIIMYTNKNAKKMRITILLFETVNNLEIL